MMKLITLLSCFGFCLQAEERTTNLKSDERIVFYPSVAQRAKGDTNRWRAEIRGCVFEPEKRGWTLAMLREALDLKDVVMTPAEEEILNERARLFLVDHERGKKVFIRLGTNEFYVGKSGADGRFSGEITFPTLAAVSFNAVLKPGDGREFQGQLFPLEAEGVSVISDIDDTIKITEVSDRKTTLRNTFLREFQAVPGMAQLYQAIARSNRASFHYISASPWQLYEPLAVFAGSSSFPAGTVELKQFRWKDRSFFSLFADPEKYKPSVIEPLLKQFPKRKFVLIGDSGERDPEIYGTLARKFPRQIARIYIRDVTNESADSARYRVAFRNMPAANWRVFREPGELQVETQGVLK